MENVAEWAGSSAQGVFFASSRDANADLMRMAPAVEPYRELSPPCCWNSFEQLGEGLGCSPGKAGYKIERHRAVACEVLSADGAGLVHG